MGGNHVQETYTEPKWSLLWNFEAWLVNFKKAHSFNEH